MDRLNWNEMIGIILSASIPVLLSTFFTEREAKVRFRMMMKRMNKAADSLKEVIDELKFDENEK